MSSILPINLVLLYLRLHFVIDFTCIDENKKIIHDGVGEENLEYLPWPSNNACVFYRESSSIRNKAGALFIFQPFQGETLNYATRFSFFSTTNNNAGYVASIIGLKLSSQLWKDVPSGQVRPNGFHVFGKGFN